MKLTRGQKKVILRGTQDNDYCIKAPPRTMNSLVDKGLATWASGFGYKFGAIIELTDKGKELRSVLLNKAVLDITKKILTL